MQKVLIAVSVFLMCTGFMLKTLIQPTPYEGDTTVSAILLALGDEKPKHYIGTFDMDKVSMGKDILTTGGPWESGGPKYRISEHFVCTDCHNMLPEAEFAHINDPDKRLAYAKEYNQLYLPGSTFYGITNRTSWFNGDHAKKYGKALTSAARNDLAEAVQLCSKELAAGRELTEEELEAVLHCFSMMELKLRDLDLSDEELDRIAVVGQTTEQKAKNVELLKSKYIQGYPATFVKAIPKKKRKMGQEGDAENGKWIYEKTCLHCHAPNKTVSDRTVFGDGKDQKGFDWLTSYFEENNSSSVYWIPRHGTKPEGDVPQFMPVFSKEKLSNSQIEDLAAYILAESKK